MKVILRVAALVLFAGTLGFLSCRAQTGVQSPSNAGRPAAPNRNEMVLPASKAGPVMFPRPVAQPAPNPPASRSQLDGPMPHATMQQAPMQSVP